MVGRLTFVFVIIQVFWRLYRQGTTLISKHRIPPATRGRKRTQQLENNFQHLKTTLNTPPLLFHQTSGVPLPVFPSASGTSKEMEINYHKARLDVSDLLMIFRYIARKCPHRQVMLLGGRGGYYTN